ncbi:MAG: hypothetical protein LE169_00370 [Endomicrobium sp.]|nr:hypothetical protein [Endomicrobium sp.]
MRVIKKLMNTAELSLELEKSVQRSCRFYSKFLVPSVVYETFSKETLPFIYEKDVPPKWIAESVFFVTIGSSLYEEYKRNEEIFGEYTGKIVSVISSDALEQSKKFIQRLVLNEAQEENCEISRVVDIPPCLYEAAAKFIPVSKIGINAESGELSPLYSTCGLFYWTSSKKRTKK